jgi:very-short-patch-repair endonuclease
MPNEAEYFVALAILACMLGIVLVVITLVRAVWRAGARTTPTAIGYGRGARAVRIGNDYAKVPRIITVTEQSFYTVLCDAVPSGYTIMVQVALNRLVTVHRLPKTHHWRDPRWSRIAQKSIDFVVVRLRDMAPLVAIELDDASHTQQLRIDRDVLLDAILHDAGLPIIHHPVQANYDRIAVQAQLIVHLTP